MTWYQQQAEKFGRLAALRLQPEDFDPAVGQSSHDLTYEYARLAGHFARRVMSHNWPQLGFKGANVFTRHEGPS